MKLRHRSTPAPAYVSSNDARTDLAAIFAEGERLAAEADAAMKSRKRRSSKRRRASSQQQQTGVVAGPTGSSSSSSCPAKRARTAARQEHGKQRQKAPGNGLATRRQSGGKLQRGRGAPDALVMSDLVEARKEKLAATASKETSCSSSQDEVDVVEESSWSFGSVLRDTLRTLSNNFNFSNLFRAANDVIKTTAASPTAGDILDHKDITKDTEEAGATSAQQQPEIDAHVVVDAPPSSPPASNPSEMMDQGRQQTDSSTSTSAAVTTASATISSVADIDAATVVAAAGVNGKQALNNSSSTLVDNSAPLTTIPLSKSPRNTRTAASASALAGRALVEVSPPKLNSKASLGNNRILEQDSKMDLSSRGNGSASVITASSIASSPLQQKQAQSKVTPSSPPSSSFVVGSSTSTATKSNQPSTSSQPLKPQLHPPSLPRASSSSSPALSVIFKSQKPQTSPSSPSLSKIVPSPLAEKRSEPLLRHTQPQQQQQQTETKITITQQALMEEEIGVNDHDSVISLDDSCDKVNPFGYTIQDDSDEERVIVIRGDDEEQAVTAKEELVPSSSPSFVNQHPTSSTATTSSPSKNIASKPNPAVGDDDDVIVISDGEVDQKEEEEDGDLMDTSVPGALSLPVTPAEAAQLPLSNPTGAFHAPLPLPAFRQTIPPSLSSTDAGKSGSVPPPIDHAVSTPLAKQHQQHTSSRSSESQPAATASSSAPMKFIMPQTPAMIFPPSSSDLSNSTPSVRKLYTQQQSLFSSSSSSSSSASVARKLSTSTAVATSTSASFLSSTDSLFSSSSSSSSLRRLNGVGGIKKSSANTSIYRKGGSVYSLVRDANQRGKSNAIRKEAERLLPSFEESQQKGFVGTEDDYKSLLSYKFEVEKMNQLSVQKVSATATVVAAAEKILSASVSRASSPVPPKSPPKVTAPVYSSNSSLSSSWLDEITIRIRESLKRPEEYEESNSGKMISTVGQTPIFDRLMSGKDSVDLGVERLRIKDKQEEEDRQRRAKQEAERVAVVAAAAAAAERRRLAEEAAAANASQDYFPPLSEEDSAKVDEALGRGNTDQVVVDYFNIPMKRSDIQTLKDGTWLNDEVINYYLELIMQRNKRYPDRYLKIHIFNTFFLTSLKNLGYKNVRRWTKKFDLFAKDLIVVPVHLGNHWCCGAINFRLKRLEYYDSLQGGPLDFFTRIRDYLQSESQDKKKVDFDFTGWYDYCPRDIPCQHNGFDCGVFTCQYADFNSLGEQFEFSQGNMRYLRKRMVAEILRKRLFTDVD